MAVIGAGPAGAMATLAAASQHKRVVILERFRIPRYKTRGGGLIGASMNMIPEGLIPPIRATATSFTFSLRGRSEQTKTQAHRFSTWNSELSLTPCLSARRRAPARKSTTAQLSRI